MAARVKITFEGLQTMHRSFSRLARGSQDLNPAMRSIAAYMLFATQLRFERGVGPNGKKWKPSMRGRSGGQTLVNTARLLKSLTTHSSANQAEVGTNVLYAAIHQTGGTITPNKAKALVFKLPNGKVVHTKKVTMPARPFLGINRQDEMEVGHILKDHFKRLAT